MNKQHIATALARLSRLKVGIKEAAVFFKIDAGTTVAELEASFHVGKQTMKGRLGILRAKKLVTSSYNKDGTVTYRTTDRGRKIITETLAP